ncbi:MAG TPA: FAD-binding oxidoreductase [Afifellaceae bacterium]|nr:FAD-binding oxidoreductase [Afifellaceae bacterium]
MKTDSLLARFAAIIGEANVLTSEHDKAPYTRERRDLFHGRCPAVLRPGSTEEVAAILKLAAAERQPLVPQSGNTGLVGGQVPDESGREIVVSLERMNRIRSIDRDGETMTVEAGVVLETVHQAAADEGLMFPLTLAAMGSCRIGGNISTNAGGTNVLAYGNTRDLVLGLEVVLADGRVWDGLRRLKKDNTGYDLKQLFIGGEGTLGIITAAVIKLFPQPRGQAVAFAGLASPRDALSLLHAMRDAAGPSLTGFEIMPRLGLEFVLKHRPGSRDPLAGPHPWYVLAEVSSSRSETDAAQLLEAGFAAPLETGIAADAALAASLDQAKAFWALRHDLSEVQRLEGGSIKHDVAVPVASVPELIDRAGAAVVEAIPGCRPIPFGHLGDGNIHINVSQPPDMDKQAFLARWDEMNAVVHAVVQDLGGSISAEHGIGVLKRELLKTVKDPLELEMMRRLKRAFDPDNILSPGRILDF